MAFPPQRNNEKEMLCNHLMCYNATRKHCHRLKCESVSDVEASKSSSPLKLLFTEKYHLIKCKNDEQKWRKFNLIFTDYG